MKKAVQDNRVCFVCESLDEALRYITGLTNLVPFYTVDRGEICEISNIRDVTVTILFTANVRYLGTPKGSVAPSKGGGR